MTDPQASAGRSTTTTTMPRRPTLNNKTGVDYWEQFPLDSIDNIHRWQQDCSSEGRSPYLDSAHSSNETLPRTKLEVDPVDRPLRQFQQSPAPEAEISMSRDDHSTQNVQDWSGANTSTAGGIFGGQAASDNLGLGRWSPVGNPSMPGQPAPNPAKAYSGHFDSDRAGDSSGTPLYSSDFQRQFFW